MELEIVKISELTLDPNNARRHSTRNIEVIANSLKEFGQRKPIVVTNNNVVIAGNGTLEAAQSLGWETITITRAPKDWNANQIKAYALTDNKTSELADWDSQILAEQLLEISEVFDIQDFGFNPLSGESMEETNHEFQDFSDDVETQYRCPKCGYEWNGSAR
jgi:ParB-like chromosome segregation protein Spo0J